MIDQEQQFSLASLFAIGGAGLYFDYNDTSRHVTVNGDRFYQHLNGKLDGPLSVGEGGRWCITFDGLEPQHQG